MTTRRFLPALLLAPLALAFSPDRPAAPADANLSKIKLPAGFTITYFAQGVKSARELAVGPDGTVYVTDSRIPDMQWFEPDSPIALPTTLYRIEAGSSTRTQRDDGQARH